MIANGNENETVCKLRFMSREHLISRNCAQGRRTIAILTALFNERELMDS